MMIITTTETWEYHFTGTPITHKYNFKNKYLAIYNEHKKKIVQMQAVEYKDVEEFYKDCSFFMNVIIRQDRIN
jgi:hypothetical protein